jgi:predicted DNA-binding transcriptional regulator AlpA
MRDQTPPTVDQHPAGIVKGPPTFNQRLAGTHDVTTLDNRIAGNAKRPKSRPRSVTQIISQTEPHMPPWPRRQADHRSLQPPGPPALWMWRLPTVLKVTGIGKTQLLDAVARGIFPKPIKVLEGGRAVAWVAKEVIQYLEGRIAKRDRDGVGTSA